MNVARLVSYIVIVLVCTTPVRSAFCADVELGRARALYYGANADGDWNSIAMLKESLKIYEKKLGSDHDTVQAVRNKLARAYAAAGQYDDSLLLSEKILVSITNICGQNHINTAVALNNLAIEYINIGQYDKALSFALRAEKIYKNIAPQSSSAIASSLRTLGRIYLGMKSYTKSIDYLEQAYNIYSGDRNQSIESIKHSNEVVSFLCVAYIKLKDIAKAKYWHNKKPSDSSQIALAYASGEYDKVLSLADSTFESRIEESPLLEFQYHAYHGMALYSMNQPAYAVPSLYKAVQTFEDIRDLAPNKNFGRFQSAVGDIEPVEIYRLFVEAVSTLALSKESHLQEIAKHKGTPAELGRYYSELLHARELGSSLDATLALDRGELPQEFRNYGDNLADVAFYFSELTKARTLLESLAKSMKNVNKVELPSDLKEKEDELRYRFDELVPSWEKVERTTVRVSSEIYKRIEQLKKNRDDLVAELQKAYPDYAFTHYPRPIPARDIPLKENEVLLEYEVSENSTTLFLIRKHKKTEIINIIINKAELEGKVKNLIASILEQNGDYFSTVKSKELYNILLGKAIGQVNASDNILIIPDGVLDLLPFEVLVQKEATSNDDTLYVGDVYPIRYYQSATVLAIQRTLQKDCAARPLFALGNPVFSPNDDRYALIKNQPLTAKSSTGKMDVAYRALAVREDWERISPEDHDKEDVIFLPLPETENEVKSIAKIFDVTVSPPDVLLGLDASEKRLNKVRLKDYRYIHFATHADLPGKLQGVNEPFILLSQVETTSQFDGFLTQSEVLNLDLCADMVVLSACLTGRGTILEGEGVANFAWAFMHAGAKSVLVSLWEVASKPTVEFMELFYGYLNDNKNRAEALRLARNEMKKRYLNPFIWAPFILYGEG